MATTCGMGWGWLPLGVVLLMSGSMFVTYTIAVLNGNVAALFPYISDAGSSYPEDAIFAQFLNIAAAIATFTLILRYQIVMDLAGDNIRINYMAKAAVVVGVIAAFGLTLVGNFQSDEIPIVHFTGAGLVFGLGEVYVILDTVITYHMVPSFHAPVKAHIRLSIAVLSAIAIVITIVADQVSSYQAEQGGITKHRKHWVPTDPGYRVHLVAAFGEWIMCVAFIVYYATLISEFRQVDVGLKLHYHHISSTSSDSAHVANGDIHKMEVNGNANGLSERDFLNVSVNVNGTENSTETDFLNTTVNITGTENSTSEL